MGVRQRIRGLGSALALSAILTGCVTSVPFRHEHDLPSRTSLSQASVLEDTVGIERTALRKNREYGVTRIRIPATERSPETFVDYYRSSIQGSRPLVLMSPVMGTSDPEHAGPYERPFLQYFAENGWDAALVYRAPTTDTDDLISSFEEGMRRSVAGAKRAIDILSQEPDVRADRLCMLGISMGGILTTVIAGDDPRIRYTVIALAGTTDKVLAHASEKSPEEFLQIVARTMETHGRDAFIQSFEKRALTQPQHYAQNLDPANTMLLISKRDRIIPLDAAEDLRSLAGFPATRYVHVFGHYGTFLLYPFLRKQAMEFYRSHIAADDAQQIAIRSASVAQRQE